MNNERIPIAVLDQEVALYEELRTIILHEWSKESFKYEENLEHDTTLPRRNYMNEEGIVRDKQLYPYDTTFYPLLDAYDQLYRNEHYDPYYKKLKDTVQDQTLFRPFGTNYSNNSSDDSLLIASDFAREAMVRAMLQAYGDDGQFSTGDEELFAVLLRILCHSCSELQSDLKLAAEVIHLLDGFIDDGRIWILRRILVTIDLFYGYWIDMVNDDSTDVFEVLFWDFMKNLRATMGAMKPSALRTIALAGFARWVFLRDFKFTSVSSSPIPLSSSRGLKRKVENVRLAFNPVNDIPTEIAKSICSPSYAALQRRKPVLDNNPDVEMGNLEAYFNSMNLLVAVGFSLIEMVQLKRQQHKLQDDDDHSGGVGSDIAVFLLRLVCQWIRGEVVCNQAQTSRQRLHSWIPRELTFRDPLCLANRILLATSERATRSTLYRSGLHVDFKQECEYIRKFDKEPPRDVLEVVRGLFLCDLAKPIITGFGYGEFLLWSGCQVKPYDGMIFW